MVRHKAYDAILFDVGGTLLDIGDPRQAACDAIAHLGAISVTAFGTAIEQAIAEWRTTDGRPEVEDLPETWVRHNCRALTLAGFDGDIPAAARLMEATFLSDGWQVYPESAEVLVALGAAGYPMGVISNWPTTLGSTLERAGLLRHFSVVVASGVVGYAKPHPRIFQIAAEQLGVDPRRIVYVGDSIEHDVVGATAAGMGVVLLDRGQRHRSHRPRIDSLSQLLEMLYPAGS